MKRGFITSGPDITFGGVVQYYHVKLATISSKVGTDLEGNGVESAR